MKITAAEAAALWGTVPAGDFSMDGVAVDSRRVTPGCLFVALSGVRADGHDFVADAFAAGARAALVSRVPPGLATGRALFVVPDPLAALQRLAARKRQEAGFRLAAVTGSSGKTTTKEMTAAILAGRFRCGKTPGNQNSLIGFPMAVLNLPAGLEVVAGEMGMSFPGELSRLSHLFRPDVAAITNVSPAHAQNFDSIEAIADAKWEILDGLASDGALVFNADDPLLLERARGYRGRKISFGFGSDADVQADGVVPKGLGQMRFTLSMAGERVEVRLSLSGRHQVANCLCAAAVAFIWGVSASDVARAAETFEPPEHRGRPRRLPSGAVLVDDSYNSNPASATAALDSLAESGAAGRKIAVLGDMLELGAKGPRLHREVGARAARCADRLVCVGPLARLIGEAAREAGMRDDAIVLVERAEEVAPALAGRLGPGDVVWVKGSRGVRLEIAVEELSA